MGCGVEPDIQYPLGLPHPLFVCLHHTHTANALRHRQRPLRLYVDGRRQPQRGGSKQLLLLYPADGGSHRRVGHPGSPCRRPCGDDAAEDRNSLSQHLLHGQRAQRRGARPAQLHVCQDSLSPHRFLHQREQRRRHGTHFGRRAGDSKLNHGQHRHAVQEPRHHHRLPHHDDSGELAAYRLRLSCCCRWPAG